jgi:hypothetical protein
MTNQYVVRLKDIPGYHPHNHTGTLNRRLIGRETVGVKHLEVLHGTLAPGQPAWQRRERRARSVEPSATADPPVVPWQKRGREVAENPLKNGRKQRKICTVEPSQRLALCQRKSLTGNQIRRERLERTTRLSIRCLRV